VFVASKSWLVSVRLLLAPALVVTCFVACGGSAFPEPTDADLARARHFAPATTVAELEEGRILFADRCSSCHQLPPPSAYPAARWEQFVVEMREQAALSSPQEQKVVLYLKVMAADAHATLGL
jgi:cytochrome c5